MCIHCCRYKGSCMSDVVADIEDLTQGFLLLQIKRILHECSCIIVFIIPVGEKDKMTVLPSILSFFAISLIFSITHVRAGILDSVYRPTYQTIKFVTAGSIRKTI